LIHGDGKGGIVVFEATKVIAPEDASALTSWANSGRKVEAYMEEGGLRRGGRA